MQSAAMRSWLALVYLAAIFAGCGASSGDPPLAPADAATSDLPSLDAVPTTDADPLSDADPRPDTTRDAAEAAGGDAPTEAVSACAPSAVVTLTPDPVEGGARFAGDNRGVTTISPLRTPTCVSNPAGVRVFSYRVRSLSAVLEATLAPPSGTRLGFDAALWIAQACSSSAQTGACLLSASGAPVTLRSGRLNRDTLVTLVVGGDGDADPAGDFVLTVRELARSVDEGMACNGPDDHCAAGTICINGLRCGQALREGEACRRDGDCATGLYCPGMRCFAYAPAGTPCSSFNHDVDCGPYASCRYGDSSQPVCTNYGAVNGECRRPPFSTSPTPCDTGLVCVQSACRRTTAVGDACDSIETTCTTGSSCVGPTGMRRCLSDGTRSARCRTEGARCDAGLTCSWEGLCRTEIADGGACDNRDATSSCIEGSHCVASRCARDGALGGNCRPFGTVRCDAGLGCNSGGTCVTGQGVGEGCGEACMEGLHCRVSAPNGPLRCLADGTFAGDCRPATAPTRCDDGLFCDASVCVRFLAVGDACTAGAFLLRCPGTAACLGAAGATRCLADGTEGARCIDNVSGGTCNAGLLCNRPFDRTYGRCVPSRATGAVCDPDGLTDRCVANGACGARAGAYRCIAAGTPGGTCRPSSTGASACDVGSCVGDRCPIASGADGGTCRSTSPACDVGLACNGTGSFASCRVAVADGEVCDVFGNLNACIAPARCNTAPGSAVFRCRRP